MWRKHSRKRETFYRHVSLSIFRKTRQKKIENYLFWIFQRARPARFKKFPRKRTITTIRAHLPLPPTKAPSTTLSTTGKIRAGNGARNTQSVSVSYSYSKKTFLSKRTPSVAKVPKSTASNVESKAFTQAEDNNTSAFYNTTQWPPTAVTVGNSCVTSGNSMNTTRPTSSETASSMAITWSDNIANDSRHDEVPNRDKTQVRLLERQWISNYDCRFYFFSVYVTIRYDKSRERRKTRRDVCIKLRISFDPFYIFAFCLSFSAAEFNLKMLILVCFTEVR